MESQGRKAWHKTQGSRRVLADIFLILLGSNGAFPLHGMARFGTARFGTARYGTAQLSSGQVGSRFHCSLEPL